jgi:hypothetical protein
MGCNARKTNKQTLSGAAVELIKRSMTILRECYTVSSNIELLAFRVRDK